MTRRALGSVRPNPGALTGLVLLTALASAIGSAAAPRDWVPERGFSALGLAGAGTVPWAATFGSPQEDWVNRVIRLRDGSFLAVGFVDRTDAGPAEWDAFTHKFAADGRAIWTRRFGGPGLDAIWSAKETPDGRLALAGFSANESAGGTDLWLLVLDAEGEPLRERRYGGAKAEMGFDVVTAADGGFLLVGQTESLGAGERDVFLVRTDAEGRERWRRTFGGPQVDRGFYGVATEDGGFAIAGVTGREDVYDMLVFKVDAEGHEAWRQVIGAEGNDPNHGINLMPDGRIVVVGYTASWGASEHDLMAVTLSPDGDLLSHELLGGPGDDLVMNSVTAADGSTWLVGYTKSFGGGDWNVMVARLTPRGRFEPWMGTIGTPYDDNGATVAEAKDGMLVFGGYSRAPSQGSAPPDLLLFEVDPASIRRRTDGVAVRRLPSPGAMAAMSPAPGPLFASSQGCGLADLETWLGGGRLVSALEAAGTLAPRLAEYRRLAVSSGARNERVMRSYVAALNRHSVDGQFGHFAAGMEYVDEGRRVRPDREQERSDREFEAANGATWSYTVVGAGLASLEMVVTEDMEFYRLLDVGPRSHRACYGFRDGKIVEARAWDWTQAGSPYQETKERFVAWLLSTRPREAARITRGRDLLFTRESAPLINALVRDWRGRN